MLSLLTLSAAAQAAPQSDPVRWKADLIWPAVSALPKHDNQFLMSRKTWTLSQVPGEAGYIAPPEARGGLSSRVHGAPQCQLARGEGARRRLPFPLTVAGGHATIFPARAECTASAPRLGPAWSVSA